MTTLSVKQTIESVIKTEIKQLINYDNAPYIKFQMIVTAIEFLGACMDVHDFCDNKQSESRFNKALTELFPKKYHKFAKKDSKINLFRDLRCGMIHKLSPLTSNIKLTRRDTEQKIKDQHLNEANGELFLVLEDFYADLDKAADKVIKLSIDKKLPKEKLVEPYLEIRGSVTGHTESNKTIVK